MIYLATPYSHTEAEVRQRRYEEACDLLDACMHHEPQKRFHSPIVAWHNFAIRQELPGGAGFWEATNMAMLGHCTELYVGKLDGWEESFGVQQEIDMAIRLHIQISYLDQFGRKTL
jgi:hypothetical protein